MNRVLYQVLLLETQDLNRVIDAKMSNFMKGVFARERHDKEGNRPGSSRIEVDGLDSRDGDDQALEALEHPEVPSHDKKVAPVADLSDNQKRQ